MSIQVAAAAITPRVLNWLNRNAAATVLHVSSHTCNLVDPQGDILSLVTPDIGRGPFALVVPVSGFKFQVSGFRVRVSSSTPAASVQPPTAQSPHSPFTIHHSPFTIDPSPVSSPQSLNLSVSQSPCLSIPPYLITTDEAELWEPRPRWDTIRPHLAKALPWLRLALLRHTPTHAAAIHQLPRFTSGIQTLCQCLKRQDETGITDATESLAGFGPGLTPAGDDGLMGVMYGVWATQAQPDEPLLSRVVAQARKRTTTLSGAFLVAAAAGEAVQAWHELVRAIGEGEGEGVYAAAKGILAIGDSSGACALAGFMAMGETGR
ncbi:MAG: DUF2877 domain-containing protein [Chloroflexi bacterium]|nr:DUF2877 domain-containing protein [Chloroflexota bacterium]